MFVMLLAQNALGPAGGIRLWDPRGVGFIRWELKWGQEGTYPGVSVDIVFLNILDVMLQVATI